MTFKAPVFIGEAVTATVEITHIRDDKPIVTLSTVCKKDDARIALIDEAVVKAPAITLH